MSWLKKVEHLDKPEVDTAVFALSLCYLCGTGTQQDIERGGALLARTAVRGNSDMKMAYAEFLHGIKNDLAGAKAIWSEVAKDASNPEAQQEAKELLRTLK
ncbi:hypothetical protein [Roseimicrobium gellanilyticum]|uniref:hypothetical protein n=1 Tax=Roseimicrobium gellanilyticum TaxID=748857 RepID=UPI0011BEBCEF|nr:hypothetical protein [Roseimicrobium gellanilyticum]